MLTKKQMFVSIPLRGFFLTRLVNIVHIELRS